MQVILLWESPDSVPRWSKRKVAGCARVDRNQQRGRMLRIKGRRYGIEDVFFNVWGPFSVLGGQKKPL